MTNTRRLALLLAFLLSAQSASADVLINEIYFDPPGGGDSFNEYIELRGTPSLSLDDHYLIFLENEFSATADPGVVENIFDFGAIGSGASLGTNGFLTIRQAFNVFDAPAAGTADFVNTGSLFTFGSTGTSTVGHTDIGEDGQIENSGFTAMLVRVDTASGGLAPTLGQDLDNDDDNELDLATGAANWTILDSIGVNSESDDIDGLLYAPINFSAGTPAGGGNIPAGAAFVDIGAEIEYIGRWGDSTGSAETDWHASNLTDDNNAGFAGPNDFRQSGDPHGLGTPSQYVETSQGVPYGMELTDTLGASNLFVLDGDYDYDSTAGAFDGDVDMADLLILQRNFGFGVGVGPTSGSTATREHGDGNRDRTVDGLDIDVWRANFGSTLPVTATLSVSVVPEPSSLLIALLGGVALAARRR